MQQKHRGSSHDSPFHPGNSPPKQYIESDKVLEKPGWVNPSTVNTKRIPFSGKISELGQVIIGDPKQAKICCTGPWDAVFPDHDPRPVHGRKQKPLASKEVGFDI